MVINTLLDNNKKWQYFLFLYNKLVVAWIFLFVKIYTLEWIFDIKGKDVPRRNFYKKPFMWSAGMDGFDKLDVIHRIYTSITKLLSEAIQLELQPIFLKDGGRTAHFFLKYLYASVFYFKSLNHCLFESVIRNIVDNVLNFYFSNVLPFLIIQIEFLF